jgi:glyoxylase-like metal-dependent hydrolase (beta-lactamase superfamily II)
VTSGGLEHPAYGQLRRVTDTASVLLCNNPGLMTLDGTNTWVLQGSGSDEMVIVDPGPDDDEHIDRIASLGKIPLVLISHKHEDHTGAIDKIVDRTGAVVRAVGSGFLRGLGGPLSDGEVIEAAGLRITVMATPGHTADSLSFLVDVWGERSDGRGGAVLTADTVLGRGTTVIDSDDGSLRDYLESLRRLHGLGPRVVLPGHGPDLGDLEAVSAMYLAHREERLDQVREALRVLGEDATARQVVEHVYTDLDEKLWDAAEKSTEAQLTYIRS